MPIYAYRCAACGHAKDVLQKLSDSPLTVCPSCGASSFAKQVTAAGFQLKGSGWYATDFKGNGVKKPDTGDGAKTDGIKTEGTKTEGTKTEGTKTEAAKTDGAKSGDSSATPKSGDSGTSSSGGSTPGGESTGPKAAGCARP
jgi:putative FmdB family regulatory protein